MTIILRKPLKQNDKKVMFWLYVSGIPLFIILWFIVSIVMIESILLRVMFLVILISLYTVGFYLTYKITEKKKRDNP